MKRNWIWIAGIAAFAIGCSKENNEPPTVASAPDASKPAAPDSFTAVQAVFKDHCISCHGAAGPKGGIDLTSYDSIIKGGDMGIIVKAGDPDGSVLIQALRGTHDMKQMPMKAAPLPEDTIKQIEAWIKAGAKSA